MIPLLILQMALCFILLWCLRCHLMSVPTVWASKCWKLCGQTTALTAQHKRGEWWHKINCKCRMIADPLRMITEVILCFYVHVMDVITGSELQVVVVFFPFKTIHPSISTSCETSVYTHAGVRIHIHIWSHLWKCISTGMSSHGGMMGCFLWWISTPGDWPLLRLLYIKLCVAAEEMAASL